MEFVDKSQEIKKALLQGGLVVSDRGTGKTKALSEILLEDPDAVVIVGNEAQSKRIKEFLLKAGLSHEECKNKIIPSQSAERFLQGARSNKNVYVDEYRNSNYHGYFKAAATSFPFAVKVIK